MSKSRFIHFERDPTDEGRLTALDEDGRIWVLHPRHDNPRQIAWHEIKAERLPYEEWKPLADAERRRNGLG